VPVPLANPFLVGAELENNDYNGLYYKHILMIVSDDCKWCLYYKWAYDHNWWRAA